MKLIVAALMMFSALAAAGAEAPAPTRNPALVYWQAAARLPVIGTAESRRISDVLADKVPAVDLAPLLAQAEGALLLFRRAANASAPCDWGLLLEDGPLAPLPHMAKVQLMARLALCEARLHFAQHENSEALQWIIDVRKAARHVAANDLLACTLTQFGMESMANTTTAALAPGLSEVARKAHLHELAKLPPLHTVTQAMKGEQICLDWTERRFAPLGSAAAPPKESGASVGPVAEKVVTNDADMKALFEQLSQNSARALIDETRGYLKRAGEVCALPWKEGRPALLALTEEVKTQGNALARILFPELLPSRERELRLATEGAMLHAALELGPALQPGPLSQHVDAMTGMPLLVKQEAAALIITTSPDATSRPVTLKIGASK